MVDRLVTSSPVGLESPVEGALLEPHRAGIQRLMRAASRSGARGTAATLLVIEGVQHRHGRPLPDGVFARRVLPGARAALGVREGHRLDRWRLIRPPREPVCAIPAGGFERLPVGGPWLALHARRGVMREAMRGFAPPVDRGDMGPQRPPPQALRLAHCLAYPLKRP